MSSTVKRSSSCREPNADLGLFKKKVENVVGVEQGGHPIPVDKSQDGLHINLWGLSKEPHWIFTARP